MPTTTPPDLTVESAVESVSWHSTRDDVAAVQFYGAIHGPGIETALRKRRNQGWLWLIAGTLVTGGMFAYKAVNGGHDPLVVVLSTLMGAVLYFALVAPVIWFTMMRRSTVVRNIRKFVRAVAARGEYDAALTPITCAVTDAALVARTPTSMNSLPWPHIREVRVEPDGFYTMHRDMGVTRIPLRAFTDDAHRERFLEAMMDRLESASAHR